MTRIVVQADTVRRAASGLVLAALMAVAPAVAADRALIDFIGYSADGRYFAFEEYGVQDGSGFPFSNIYVIDLPADQWVSGSPYRVRLEGDTDSVGEVRAQARSDAQATLEKLDISVGAFPIAINADGEPDAAAYGLRFGTPGFGLDGVQDEHLLTLETIPLPAGQDCSIIDNKTVGFALLLDGDEVHRDTGKLPASRGCAMDYRLYAVVQAPDWLFGEPAQRVAVISVYPFGFEGPDRRFLVVPLPFE